MIEKMCYMVNYERKDNNYFIPGWGRLFKQFFYKRRNGEVFGVRNATLCTAGMVISDCMDNIVYVDGNICLLYKIIGKRF